MLTQALEKKTKNQFFKEEQAMKKVISILVVGIFAVLLSLSASAAESMSPTEERNLIEDRISQWISEYVHSEHYKEICGNKPEQVAALKADVDAMIRETYAAFGWQEVETMPHTAEQVREIAAKEVDPRALELAYLDLDSAPEYLKDYILSARRAVIYHFTWQADPQDGGFGINPQDRGNHTYEIMPYFGDLFPGWYEPSIYLVLPDWREASKQSAGVAESDVEPVKTSVGDEQIVEAVTAEVEEPAEELAVNSTDYSGYSTKFDAYYYLSNPSAGVVTQPFTTVSGDSYSYTDIAAGAMELIQSANYNLGIHDVNSGTSYQYWGSITGGYLNDWGRFSSTAVSYGIRASTFSTAGPAKMKVLYKKTAY